MKMKKSTIIIGGFLIGILGVVVSALAFPKNWFDISAFCVGGPLVLSMMIIFGRKFYGVPAWKFDDD